MGAPLLILIITNTTNLLLLFLVLYKRKRESTKHLNGIFAGSIIALVLWSVCNYFADSSRTIESALFWTKATFPAALFMCWFVFYFSNIFPTAEKQQFLLPRIYLCIVLGFSLISMGHAIIESVELQPGIGISDVTVGWAYVYVLVLYLTLIGHATWNFVRNYRTRIGKTKIQTKYALIGWGFFLSLAVTTNAILPLITGNADWSKFGPLGSVVMVACISYAMIRYQFLNIQIIIQRGLIYSILLFGIITVYIGLVFTGEYLFNRSSNTSIFVSALITTVVSIFGVPPLKAYFQKLTAPIFFKDQYDYATVLSTLTDILNKNLSQDLIVEKSVVVLKQALKSKNVIFDFENNRQNIDTGIVLSVPIKSNQTNIGTLHLGEKRSEDPYTHEDMRLLGTFCSQAGVAFEKARLYQEVEAYAATLERKVEARTAEIKKLQEDQEAMMVDISHGLQTPLTIMKGELFFLRKQGYELDRVAALDTSIDRISTFIYRFLNLSRKETQIARDMQPCFLADIVESVIASCADLAIEKNISIEAHITHRPMVIGNQEELAELVMNLVENGIKYMSRDREGRIVVGLDVRESYAHLTIQDTGIGITPENVQKLFTKFFRVKEGETKNIAGTGLGLAICKRIVEVHGGTISVESVFGEGTTFTVVLPVVEVGKLNLIY